MKIAFIHPKMVLGGAELLIVNFAQSLYQNDYEVKIITSYYDKNNTFE